MNLVDPCRRCEQASAWLLRPVREHDGVMPIEARFDSAGAIQLVGWYEAIVCANCGWAQFWAQDFAPTLAAATIPACLECAGASGWTVDQASDIMSPKATAPIWVELAPCKPDVRYRTFPWRGPLAVRICAQCSAASWFCVPEVAYVADLEQPVRSPRACRRCRSPQISAQMIDRSGGLERMSTSPRAIAAGHGAGRFALLGEHMGRFELDVCLGCFSVEWHGLELATMHESAELGVSRIERGHGEGGSGPYR